MKRKRLPLIVLLALIVVATIVALTTRKTRILLTGIVTTDEVIVSPEIQGRLQELKVNQGDRVKRGQLLAVLSPAEWRADLAFFENGERAAAAQTNQAE